MAETTGISWADATFNAWRGCDEVDNSPACDHCYAKKMAKRNPVMLGRWGGHAEGGTRVVAAEKYWFEPLKWNRDAEKAGVRRRVFAHSISDLFEDWRGPMLNHHGKQLFHNAGSWSDADALIAEEQINDPVSMQDVRNRLFKLTGMTLWLDYLFLTKRPENIQRMMPTVVHDVCEGGLKVGEIERRYFPNIWLGCTTENQEHADKRIPELLKCSGLAASLFLSAEPLLGDVDLRPALWLEDQYFKFRTLGKSRGINWVIGGGESGPNARPSHPDWFRSLRDQCGAAGVPFHFKQWGEYVGGSDFARDDGYYIEAQNGEVYHDPDPTLMHHWDENCQAENDVSYRVGKVKAGRLLDSVLYDASISG